MSEQTETYTNPIHRLPLNFAIDKHRKKPRKQFSEVPVKSIIPKK